MKKLFTILLASVLLLGLTGCQNTNPKLQNPDDPMALLPGQTDTGKSADSDDRKETGTEVHWCTQYIRTNGSSEAMLFPSVRIIDSLQELKDYYNAWHETFDLDRKEKVYSDTTIGFLDACDPYDETFFEKNCLIFVLLEEGSGSVRHEVRSVEQTADKRLSISIARKVPEVGTEDMAQWHIILELSRDVIPESPNDILVSFDDNTDHSHQVVSEAQTVEDPVTGYCGNTQTTLYVGDKEYSFMYGYSVTLTDILINLDYDPIRVCRCAPEYTVDTEFGTGYGINLSQGYARCEKGQADLTQEQIDTIAQIIEWAETTNCKYPIDN